MMHITIYSNTKQLSLKVLKADLHGCLLKGKLNYYLITSKSHV